MAQGRPTPTSRAVYPDGFTRPALASGEPEPRGTRSEARRAGAPDLCHKHSCASVAHARVWRAPSAWREQLARIDFGLVLVAGHLKDADQVDEAREGAGVVACLGGDLLESVADGVGMDVHEFGGSGYVEVGV
jgi:hypothetical protein